MAYSHTIQLELLDPDGAATIIDTFDGYDIILDCFHPGSPFTFNLWRSVSRRSTWAILRSKVKVGMDVLIRIDGAVQMNGSIEQLVEPIDRKGGAQLVISGRDLSARAMAWDASPNVSFVGLNLEDAISRLYADLNIEVVVGADANYARDVQAGTLRGTAATSARRRRHRSKVVNRAHPRSGEKVWQVAETMIRRAGLFQWIAPIEGRDTMAVILDRYDYKSPVKYTFARRTIPSSGALTGNILASQHTISTRDVPTHVRVYGHCARGDKYSFRYNPLIENRYLKIDEVTRGRVVNPHPLQPKYVKSQRARTFEEGAQEAERIIARAMMGFRRVEVTVQGHGQTDSQGRMVLYAINTTAQLLDEVLGLNEKMFVQRVQFQGSRQRGSTTHITLIPLLAVQLTHGVTEGI